jgi:hypothetical protein
VINLWHDRRRITSSDKGGDAMPDVVADDEVEIGAYAGRA